MAKQGKRIAPPNSVRKAHYLSRMGAMPRTAGVHQISVAHDDWGGIFAGQRCACPLAITLPWSPPATA
jgi:hypothetical protein